MISLASSWGRFIEWLEGHEPSAQVFVVLLSFLVTLGLVGVTAVYAMAARRQADASAKMAEEMREQRRDAARPVIDIEVAPLTVEEEGPLAMPQGLAPFIKCRLRNVGAGPALNVTFNVSDGSGKTPVPKGVGAVAAGAYAKEWFIKKRIDEWPLAVEVDPPGTSADGVLRVRYEDVFGNARESLREVPVGDKLGPFGYVGPLRVRDKYVGLP
jgi:hypothetical protein